MKITVCIGSSCHLKGSRLVVEELQQLVKKHNLSDRIELASQFCMGRCQGDGVAVAIDGEIFSLTPDAVASFFETDVLTRL